MSIVNIFLGYILFLSSLPIFRSKEVFLKGSASKNGSGTRENPYNDLETAFLNLNKGEFNKISFLDEFNDNPYVLKTVWEFEDSLELHAESSGKIRIALQNNSGLNFIDVGSLIMTNIIFSGPSSFIENDVIIQVKSQITNLQVNLVNLLLIIFFFQKFREN